MFIVQGQATHPKKPPTQIKTVCTNSLRKPFLPVSAYLQGKKGDSLYKQSVLKLFAQTVFLFRWVIFWGGSPHELLLASRLSLHAGPLSQLALTRWLQRWPRTQAECAKIANRNRSDFPSPDPPTLAFLDFLVFLFSDIPCFFVRFSFLFQGFLGGSSKRERLSLAFSQESKGWRVRVKSEAYFQKERLSLGIRRIKSQLLAMAIRNFKSQCFFL